MVRFLKKKISIVSFFLLILMPACSENRISLSYTPLVDQSLEMSHKTLIVTTLSDHRFRLYSFGANSMPDVAGWGQGTGTLTTPQSISRHVSQSIVRQYRDFGAQAQYRPDLSCRITKEKDGSYRASSSYPGPVLCGSILDYQFQIDHSVVGFGTYISTFDMAAGATIKAQVALHLFLVNQNTILWDGYVGSSDGMKDVKGPHLKEKAVAILEHTLGITIEQSAREVSDHLEKI
ncbi:MAG: hypothetical protein ACYCXP_11365 [Leptospirillum sp.]